jgi:hypothetical protein
MNLDIVSVEDGQDLGTAVTAVSKAGNVLSVQQGNLEYAPLFGVDLRYFLESPFVFQNESFKSYLVERLTYHQINVTEVLETLETLYASYVYFVDNQDNSAGGFIT